MRDVRGRQLLAVMLFGLASVWSPVTTVAQPPTLIGVAQLLSDAAASVDKFADGLTKLVQLGDFLFPISDARRAQARLIDIKARTVQLLLTNKGVVGELDNYIKTVRTEALDKPRAGLMWQPLTSRLGFLLTTVQELLRDVERERSEFVATPAYDEFVRALRGRESLLSALMGLEPPVSEVELKQLEFVSFEYKRLIVALDKANNSLGSYILAAEEKRRKPPKP